MFCLSIFRGANQMLRCMVVAACIFLIIGPILVIVGIALIASPNHRVEWVNSYNAAGDSFTSTQRLEMTKVAMSITSGFSQTPALLVNQAQSVPVTGNKDGVNIYQSIVLQTTAVPSSSLTSAVVSATKNGLLSSTLSNLQGLQVPTTQSNSVSISCTKSECTSASSDCTCPSSAMSSKCTRQYSGSYTDSSGSCREGNTCGTCRYQSYVSQVCLPVAVGTSAVAVAASSLASCYYPFQSTSARYSSSNANPTLSIMDENDPFIALERITKGADNFGLTAAEQTAAGLSCLVIGGIICLVVGGVFVFLFRSHKNEPQQQPQQQQGQPMQAVPVAQPVHHQPQHPEGSPQYGQPAYGQPQPAYGQPQPAYDQPQPAYGQPQPAYGQPQPAYGQPQPAYGQPQPAYGQPQPAYGQPQPASGQPMHGEHFGLYTFNQPQPANGEPAKPPPAV